MTTFLNEPDTTRRAHCVQLCLLGDFMLLLDGEPVVLPPAEQRLLACLACAQHPRSRGGVASSLWPDTDPTRAYANLRTCLWRARHLGFEPIRSIGHSLQLDPSVSVDLHRGMRLARGVSERTDRLSDDAAQRLLLLGQDLLPHWFDEWLEPYRNQYRRLRIQALEDAARRLLANGRPGAAVGVAAEAVAAESLRDSAHWILIRAFMAEGNHGKAVEQYRRYAEILRVELGVPVPLTLTEILDQEP